MICPYCTSNQSKVINTRQNGRVRDRRYECLVCEARYSTRERLRSDDLRLWIQPTPKLVKAATELERGLLKMLDEVKAVLEELSVTEGVEEWKDS